MTKISSFRWFSDHQEPFPYLRLYFDGSCKDGVAISAWILYGSGHCSEDRIDDWIPVASHSYTLGIVSVSAAELEALCGGVFFLAS